MDENQKGDISWQRKHQREHQSVMVQDRVNVLIKDAADVITSERLVRAVINVRKEE